MLDFFQYHQGVKQFGSRSDLTFCRALSGSKQCAKVIDQQMIKVTLAGKELNTEKLLDTTFWLKPWLKSKSFGFNFYDLASVGYNKF